MKSYTERPDIALLQPIQVQKSQSVHYQSACDFQGMLWVRRRGVVPPLVADVSIVWFLSCLITCLSHHTIIIVVIIVIVIIIVDQQEEDSSASYKSAQIPSQSQNCKKNKKNQSKPHPPQPHRMWNLLAHALGFDADKHPCLQLRRQARQRREFIYKKSIEDRDRTIAEKKQRLKRALDGESVRVKTEISSKPVVGGKGHPHPHRMRDV